MQSLMVGRPLMTPGMVSELLVWNGVCACLLVELPFLDGIAVGVEQVKGFFGVKAFIVFFRRFCGNGGNSGHHSRFGEGHPFARGVAGVRQSSPPHLGQCFAMSRGVRATAT